MITTCCDKGINFLPELLRLNAQNSTHAKINPHKNLLQLSIAVFPILVETSKSGNNITSKSSKVTTSITVAAKILFRIRNNQACFLSL